jgi:hypothetical protein
MKTLGRILIILLATAVVTGAIVAIVNANGSSRPGGFQPPRGTEFRPQGGFQPQGGFPNGGGRPERGGDGGFRGGLGWLLGMVKNVGLIAVIVAVIVLPKSLFKKRGPRVAEEDTAPVESS